MLRLGSVPKIDVSVAVLIVANLIPIYGVLFLGWDLPTIIITYWAESAIIGLYTLLKAVWFLVYKQMEFLRKKEYAHLVVSIVAWCVAVGYVLLWSVAFMAFHLMFIVAFLFGGHAEVTDALEFPPIATQLAFAHLQGLVVLALAVSHGMSFIVNFVGKREYREDPISNSAFIPRMVALQLVLGLGMGLSIGFDVPHAFLVVLIAAKLWVDWHLHVTAHQKIQHRLSSTA